ncbi:hypothetical protein [Klebsiella pneumoniae IS39]|nr:hypothetical protein [Klebsiella pneumoniae IS39]
MLHGQVTEKGVCESNMGGVLKTKNPAEAGFLYKEAKII